MTSPAGTRQTIRELVDEFNLRVSVDFNREYVTHEPEFADIFWQYESGLVSETSFPFWGFIPGMQEFGGSRKHNTFPSSEKFKIVNREFDNSVDIPKKDFERAGNTANSILPLNPYQQRINDMFTEAKDFRFELGFDLIKAGATSEAPTFDGQPLYATTHAYKVDTAGTEDNIVVGAGVSVDNIETDIKKVLSRFAGFKFDQAENQSQRQLNKRISRRDLVIVAPTELFGVFDDLMNKTLIDNSNNLNLGIRVVHKLFPADANDWYAFLTDNKTQRALIIQNEIPVRPDFPSDNKMQENENKLLTWGAEWRGAVCPGAWWKTIKVTNV